MLSSEEISFEAAFPERVKNGSSVTVVGKMKSESWFVLNLVCRSCEEIALHCSFRLDQLTVVRNHYSDGWGDEERSGGWPIRKSGEFEITVEIEEDYFKIFIDGELFACFRHRMPYSKITHVNGSVEAAFTLIKFEKKEKRCLYQTKP